MKVDHHQEHIVLTLEGGYEESVGLSNEMNMVKAGSIPKNIVLDVSTLDFIQSFQIGMLVKVKTVAEDENGKFALVGKSDEIKDILEVIDSGLRCASLCQHRRSRFRFWLSNSN